MITLGSPSFDEANLLIQERLADATREALVHEALSASRTPKVALRPRLATALRALACRLDPSFA
jgi:hypothetical protein